MKLALIIDDYLPHSTRVGAKMYHELAVELIRRGHQVTVITPGFRITLPITIESLDGVSVWRFKSGPIKDVGKISRAINESVLSLRAWKAIEKLVKPDTFDGIVYYSPSIFWGGLVKKIKHRCRCPAYLVLRDLFPQWAIDAGILRKGSIFEMYFRFFERQTYKQANRIGLMSEKNLEIFKAENKGLPCEVLRNWADLTNNDYSNVNFPSLRERLNLRNKIIFLYGGNIGYAQDIVNLMRLVRNMTKYDNAHFLFVGQGDQVGLICNLARKWSLSNFTYLPSVPQNEFKSILGEVDIGLFSLSSHHTAHNFPGKLLGYMLHSLPILGSVNIGNDLLDIVNSHRAGYIHINGEDDELLLSAEKLYRDKSLRITLGDNAYTLLEEQFSVASAAQSIEVRLEVGNAIN